MKPYALFWIRSLSWLFATMSCMAVLHGQLAITEVMSSAGQFLGATPITPRPDFWELTNFGTNTVDLSDYRFNDSGGIEGAQPGMFAGIQIGPGKSIVFFQSSAIVSSAAQFRAWWGENQLPADLQAYSYPGPGLSSASDAVQLWRVIDGASTTLVDRVELTGAFRGSTFTYSLTTGLLDRFSVAGEGGAFKAVETDDIGSPGFTTGAVPLAIVASPQSQTVDGGSSATLRVLSVGLPRPRFQWFFNGGLMAGETADFLEIAPAAPHHTGSYSVELNNGLKSVQSGAAILTVNTTPIPPSVVEAPSDLIVGPSQTGTFRVKARGYPLPSFQWAVNGTDIPGANSSSLAVTASSGESSQLYSVRVQNPHGSTNVSVLFNVRPLPRLIVTEMMGTRSTNTSIFGRADWWELTNFETYSVNLRGYRFDDEPGALSGAVVITNDLVIQPGESVLFIQDMTPEFFTEWWGEENLPQGVQFVRYAGNGFNVLEGDSLWLWNATPINRIDYVWQAAYGQVNGDPTLTFWCDGFDEFGWNSVLGQCGAIRATLSDDIGSPGYITNHPPRTVAPRCLAISRNGPEVQLTWKTQPGKRYELQAKQDLNVSGWNPITQRVASGTQLILTDTPDGNAPRRFYRLVTAP